MLGIGLNALGVIVGSAIGLVKKAPMTQADEQFFKIVMGAGTVFIGLQLAWKNISGSFGSVMKQIFIVVLAMILGKLVGRLLRLQKISNSVGKYASERFKGGGSGQKQFNDAFLVASLLSCASPLAVFASVHEGFAGFSPAFFVKAAMDGLAAVAFVSMLGWGVILSVIPLVAYQGTIFLLVKSLEPTLQTHGLIASINATNGMLIFCVALIIFNLKKIELTDYIPSLAVAPLITWFWK